MNVELKHPRKLYGYPDELPSWVRDVIAKVEKAYSIQLVEGEDYAFTVRKSSSPPGSFSHVATVKFTSPELSVAFANLL